MGLPAQPEHGGRYDRADEFMEVAYKLWEGSWDDDAVVGDRARRVYTRPDRVRRVVHQGARHRRALPADRRLAAAGGRRAGALGGRDRRRRLQPRPDRDAACFEDIVDLIVPALQERGAYKTGYAARRWREKLFDQGPRLPARHAVASFRRPAG